MSKTRVLIAAALLAATISVPSGATYNASADGTITYLTQMGPSVGFTTGTVVFTIAGQPPNTCQVNGYQQFLISPASVPDVQSRNNMFAILVTAKATGAQVRVAYDNAGGFCDQNSLAVYWLSLL
jgi:hypothetical protein